ncbi:hypothetical protein M422DRAFT_196506 [Sphaerobolus stellatus SS14]|uniref:CxC2-like cysteine cluster KDZ transposase-associated domain-containing protein n=1 Tax=Sphaerobolus stellatus (strain SS14) TaxID=990650 RepID=A0A0C9TMA0_SPHS4|nr:hypothetical protein M422DRAFT_196506 [Sphaerobolus stellatus SS14]
MLECPEKSITICGKNGCTSQAIYECSDCDNPAPLCENCLVDCHRSLPLHRPMKWNGMYYERESLAKLGIVWYLGYAGMQCPYVNEGRGIQELTVLDITGVHTISVGFCQCSKGPEPAEQLLLVKLFPATVLRPQTAFSFRALKLFHMVHLTAHTTVWDFIGAMHRLSNCLDFKALHGTYKQFNFVQRQWRIIRAWCQSGRTTIDGPKTDIPLAMPCVSCPMPKVNIPPNWDCDPDR